jgi:hypothetical protein
MPMINARRVPDAQEAITPGEAIAAMMLHGLGCANRPLSLTPQFFARQPLDLVCRAGMSAELFNRVQRGRTLDEADTDGCARRCQELALAVGAHDGIDLRGKHLDTTSGSRSGADGPERAEHALTITHGDSRDHRPDVKPGGLARMVSPDGGVPLLRNSWDGTTADPPMVQGRAQALMSAVQHAPRPRALSADATLYHDHHAAHRAHRGFLTRLPHTMGAVSPGIRPALAADTWHPLEEPTRAQRLALCHDGSAQRWLVVHAPAADERAEAPINHPRQREEAALTPPRFPLPAPRVETPAMAHAALPAWARRWTAHPVASYRLSAHQRDARQGRPAPHTPLQAITWPVQAHARPAQEARAQRTQRQAGVGLGTNMDASALGDPDVLHAYQGQSRVEGGLRVRNDPRCFVSSLLVKQPCRRQGSLRVMTRALVVYAVTPRRRRQPWAEHHATVPNHMHQPTMAPT